MPGTWCLVLGGPGGGSAHSENSVVPYGQGPPTLESPILSAILGFWFHGVTGMRLGKGQRKTNSSHPPCRHSLSLSCDLSSTKLWLAREPSHGCCTQRDHRPVRHTQTSAECHECHHRYPNLVPLGRLQEPGVMWKGEWDSSR